MSEGLAKSGDVHGKHLVGQDGVRLGAVRELFLDLAAGRIEFLIVEGASLLGGSGKYHPVPWAAARYDSVAGEFRIDMAKDMFKAAPSYDREQLANPNYAWNEQAARYFAAPRPAYEG
jgi:hypothetical protein